ncbi:MAG: hypothetical protein U0231_09415 [Nitrospiraceae bacterium]
MSYLANMQEMKNVVDQSINQTAIRFQGFEDGIMLKEKEKELSVVSDDEYKR